MPTSVSRRRITRSAAWAAPAVLLTSTAPSASASTVTDTHLVHWGSTVRYRTDGLTSSQTCLPGSTTSLTLDNTPTGDQGDSVFWIQQTAGSPRMYEVLGLVYTVDLPVGGLQWTVMTGDWAYVSGVSIGGGFWRYTFQYYGTSEFASASTPDAATNPYFSASSSSVAWCSNDPVMTVGVTYTAAIDGEAVSRGGSFDVKRSF